MYIYFFVHKIYGQNQAFTHCGLELLEVTLRADSYQKKGNKPKYLSMFNSCLNTASFSS